MSTTGRPDAAHSPGDVAGQLREAAFVHLVADATGDGVAATALLATALDGETPYQVSVAPLPERADRATDADLTVGLGRTAGDADISISGDGKPASRQVHDIAAEFGSVDGTLAIAGALAGGADRDESLLSLAERYGFERRPGVAVPTADLADGLAHSTLVHAGFSGDSETARDALDSLGSTAEDIDHRTVASVVATTVVEADPSTRGSRAVERFLRPLVGGPVGTLGGFGDVLDATARVDPGLATAFGLGYVDPGDALEVWREHAQRAHEGLREAKTGRYDGLFVLRCDSSAPLGTVARLGCEYRSPEPVVLAVADGEAAVRTERGTQRKAGSVVRDVAETAGGTAGGTTHRARARFAAEATEYLLAFREAL
ncbi:MAG: hypothetical protein V5A55_06030 [Halovenus sp.]